MAHAVPWQVRNLILNLFPDLVDEPNQPGAIGPTGNRRSRSRRHRGTNSRRSDRCRLWGNAIHKVSKIFFMNDPNSSSTPTTRATLKLKAGARKPQPEPKVPTPPPPSSIKTKPGARWSDDHTQQMQADMDSLARR